MHVEHVNILTLQICEEYEVKGMWSTRYKSTWMTNRLVSVVGGYDNRVGTGLFVSSSPNPPPVVSLGSIY